MLRQGATTDFETDLKWESAARLLDLDPQALRQVREPSLECVSRMPCAGGTAVLYITAGAVVSGETVATIAVGPGLNGASAREALEDCELDAVLAGVDHSCAAIVIQQPSGAGERELWECARDCAPILARVLGATILLPNDVASMTFARWSCSAAVQYRVPFSVMDESRYATVRTAKAMTSCASWVLRERAKFVQGASIAVIGSGMMAQCALQAFAEAGAKVVAAADESGALVETKGLDVTALLAHVHSGGLLAEFAGGEHILRADALGVASDLVIWADDGEIHTDMANRIHAKVVLLAPGARAGDVSLELLEEKSATVIPPMLSRCVRLFPEADHSGVRRRIEAICSDLRELREERGLSLDAALRIYVLKKLTERGRWARP